MTTILILNAISSALAALGLGGYTAHRRRRAARDSRLTPAYLPRQRRR